MKKKTPVKSDLPHMSTRHKWYLYFFFFKRKLLYIASLVTYDIVDEVNDVTDCWLAFVCPTIEIEV